MEGLQIFVTLKRGNEWPLATTDVRCACWACCLLPAACCLLPAACCRLPPTGDRSGPCMHARCSIRYDQTVRDLREAVAKKLDVPPEQQQLFWHKRELTVGLRHGGSRDREGRAGDAAACTLCHTGGTPGRGRGWLCVGR